MSPDLRQAPSGPLTAISLFNTWEPDELHPMHIAALTGNDDLIRELMATSKAAPCSSRGLEPIHYACIGGHLGTLKLLISQGVACSPSSHGGISLLHLCVFFNEQDVSEAVKLLLQQGVDPNSQSHLTGIKWEYHDIFLHGTALQWAILCRNRALVHDLVPFTQDYRCLEVAVDCSYWEIVEEILKHVKTRNDISRGTEYLFFSPRPFSHWIAHGADEVVAIRRTAEVLEHHEHGFDHNEDSDILPNLVTGATSEAQLVHLITWLNMLSDAKLKQMSSNQETVLSMAITHATKHILCRDIIQKLVDKYTVEELEANVLFQGSYLHLALGRESVIGTRILLAKGVDVNQRTFDPSQDTPLHLCITMGKNMELYNLLLEYGADLTASSSALHTTPYQSLFVQPNFRADTANLVLKGCKTSSDFAEILSGNFFMQLHSTNEGFREYFRLLLRSHYMSEYINKCNDDGTTMIHVAALYLDPDTANTLLEAGADAMMKCGQDSDGLLALQIACRSGRRFWRHTLPDHPILLRRKAGAMKTASDLLHWYHAQPNDPFKGITKRHLACHMGIEEEVQKLVMADYDRKAKGFWPGIDFEVDARQLRDIDPDKIPQIIPLGGVGMPGFVPMSEILEVSDTSGRIDELLRE